MRYRIKLFIRAAKYLFLVRAALPKWMRWLIAVALPFTMALGIPDFGFDEAIYTVLALALWFRHRTLLRAVWHAAELETSLCPSQNRYMRARIASPGMQLPTRQTSATMNAGLNTGIVSAVKGTGRIAVVPSAPTRMLSVPTMHGARTLTSTILM